MVAQIPAPARLPHAAACRPLCTMHAQLAASSLRLRRMLVRVRRRLGLLAFSSPVSGYADSTACRSHHTTVWLQTHKSEDPRRRQRTQAKPAAAAVRAGNALPRSRRSLRRPPRRATPLFFRRPAARPASLVQRHEMPPRTHRSKPATRFRPAATVSSAFVARPCPLRGGSSSPPRAARGGGRPTHRQRKKERGCELTPVTQFFRCPMARGRGDSTAFHPQSTPPAEERDGVTRFCRCAMAVGGASSTAFCHCRGGQGRKVDSPGSAAAEPGRPRQNRHVPRGHVTQHAAALATVARGCPVSPLPAVLLLPSLFASCTTRAPRAVRGPSGPSCIYCVLRLPNLHCTISSSGSTKSLSRTYTNQRGCCWLLYTGRSATEKT